MIWEVSDSVDIFALLKKLERVWHIDLSIMLFSDGSGHIMNPYAEVYYTYFEWDTEDQFLALVKKLGDDPEANKPNIPTTMPVVL
jgi:hypothetical protein